MDKLIAFLMSICITISALIFGAMPALPSAPVPFTEPEPADTAYVYDKIDGVGGACFYIGRPKEETLLTVHSRDFGMSEGKADNTAELNEAFAYCAAHKGTKLIIDRGVYRFTGNDTIGVFGCENLLVEGNGSKFIFTSTASYNKLSFANSSFVEFRNLNVDWDWENDPIGSAVEIVGVDSKNHTMDLLFTELSEVSESIVIKAMTQCDEKTFTMGADRSSNEVYFYQIPYSVKSVEKLSSNVLRVTHSGVADHFEKGQVYMLRHHVYDSSIFRLEGESNNLTFNHINIFASSGMAFTAGGNCSRFQIKNTYIGVPRELSHKRHISLGADAIHIADTNGYFNIENCDISGMGDDAINVHDNLGYVTEKVNETTVKAMLKFNAGVGTVVGFKDGDFNSLELTAAIEDISTADGVSTIVFDRPVADIEQGFILFNSQCNSGNYVIRNNYFHENRARGLLLQSSNGLCENNRFYKTMGQAIEVVMDIEPGLWFEGTGVDNLVIRNNEFVLCDYSNWGQVIEMGTNYAGKELGSQPFTNIEISGNKFVDCYGYTLRVRSANGVKIKDNHAEINSTSYNNGKLRIEKSAYNIDLDSNTVKFGCAKTKLIPQCEGLRVWCDVKGFIAQG